MKPKTVLTIGKFEGIHLGHRLLLEEVAKRAKEKNLVPTVIVFEPHPFIHLRDKNYKLIFTPNERDNLLKSIGIKNIIKLEFTKAFTNKTATEFCKEIFENFNAQEVIIGENFHFGKNREGTPSLLKNFAKNYNANVTSIPIKNTDLSTSSIRDFLEKNELSKACDLLGFPFFVAGEVTKGRQLGRVLGFPTLNIYPAKNKFLPAFGVYETITNFSDGKKLKGLTNVGLRPTVNNDSTVVSVETHIPSLIAKPDEMYGQNIKVEFIRFIRKEIKFNNTDELKNQIQIDLKEF